jgi:uncharacterized membrane protein
MRLHPVHTMVIHFPTALLIMDVVFGSLAFYRPNDTLWHAAYYSAIAGLCGGWLAVLTGLLDLFQGILKHGTKATTLAFTHGGVQFFVITGFTVLVSLEFKNPQLITSPPIWLWTVKIFLLLIMIVGNYLGGELLMKYIAKDFQSDNTTP